jgi:hypothetical protein
MPDRAKGILCNNVVQILAFLILGRLCRERYATATEQAAFLGKPLSPQPTRSGGVGVHSVRATEVAANYSRLRTWAAA